MVLAIRRDDVDPGEGRTTRSAGVRYRLTEFQSLRAHWSEGFKPPSFFALGDPIVGNPALRPETSRSREAGWEMATPCVHAQASVYDTRYDALVDFDPDTFHMVNREGARVRGAELQGSYAFDDATRGEASYGYMNA